MTKDASNYSLWLFAFPPSIAAMVALRIIKSWNFTICSGKFQAIHISESAADFSHLNFRPRSLRIGGSSHLNPNCQSAAADSLGNAVEGDDSHCSRLNWG